MEFITDLIASIDEDNFINHNNLRKILQPYGPEKKGSCYIVRGDYKQMEEISNKLQQINLKSVDVSVAVMTYIDQKCTKELSRIKGNSFDIETKSDHNKPSGTVQVTLRPSHHSISPDRADMVRQRFITFYQRTASDLQVTSVPVSLRDHDDLQKRFPHLLFKAKKYDSGSEVTGPFMHIAKLKEFLHQNTPSASKSPLNKGPGGSPGNRTSGPSIQSRDCGDELCPICMDQIATGNKTTLRCKHTFCKDCLKTAFDYKPVCPTCGELYGTLTGTQPAGGTMNVNTSSTSLPGYEKYGTIVIDYYIPSGIQMEEHPNPGQPYEGVSRTAYLPNSTQGKKILKLLRRAFDQRLIFTVGRSTTSGRNNMVTWNDIHHKTSTHGGPTHYGYPDPDYLNRVRDELKVKGIE